jgi:hypothetical protein
VILEVDRKRIRGVGQFERALSEKAEGDPLLLLIRRGNATVFLPLEAD